MKSDNNPEPVELLDIEVTRIKDRWFGRLTVNGEEVDQMSCALKEDVGWMCREMLRWYDKLGGVSKWAQSARRRQGSGPKGKVWYKKDLTNEDPKP